MERGGLFGKSGETSSVLSYTMRYADSRLQVFKFKQTLFSPSSSHSYSAALKNQITSIIVLEFIVCQIPSISKR